MHKVFNQMRFQDPESIIKMPNIFQQIVLFSPQ